jgi:ATP-dependent Clp protease ATP-binding subunit ClpB
VVKYEYVVASREFWSIDELHTLLGLGKVEGSIDASNNSIRINNVALVATATYSNRYITDRFLPDKTIDLADEAISALRLQQDSKPDAIREFDREITTLQFELEWLRKEIKYGKRRKLKSRTKEELERSRFELEQV